MGFDNIDEILDYAISREEEAAALYTDLAELADRPGMREAFLEFAEEEEGHRRHLESIKAGELPALLMASNTLGKARLMVSPISSIDALSLIAAMCCDGTDRISNSGIS